MKKKAIILAIITTLTLTACGGGGVKEEGTKEASAVAQANKKESSKENKMIGGEEIGDGIIYLVNESGTTEDGNILYVQYQEDMQLMQLGFEAWEMDGTQPTYIYLNGEEIEKTQLGDTQSSINLTGKALKVGIHNVEFIQRDGDNVTFYRLAQYEVKK